MLSAPLRLFDERPAALRLYQHAYRHILVDEFQDVSAAQYALLRRLADGAGEWRGSRNQRVIDMAATQRCGHIVRLD